MKVYIVINDEAQIIEVCATRVIARAVIKAQEVELQQAFGRIGTKRVGHRNASREGGGIT